MELLDGAASSRDDEARLGGRGESGEGGAERSEHYPRNNVSSGWNRLEEQGRRQDGAFSARLCTVKKIVPTVPKTLVKFLTKWTLDSSII